MNIPDNKPHQSLFERIRRRFIGAPRNINEPSLFHKISLIPVLAWIGLGADGLSSSSYGPEEAFKALGSHTYLAVFIAIATALTVFIIAYAYSRMVSATTSWTEKCARTSWTKFFDNRIITTSFHEHQNQFGGVHGRGKQKKTDFSRGEIQQR